MADKIKEKNEKSKIKYVVIPSIVTIAVILSLVLYSISVSPWIIVIVIAITLIVIECVYFFTSDVDYKAIKAKKKKKAKKLEAKNLKRGKKENKMIHKYGLKAEEELPDYEEQVTKETARDTHKSFKLTSKEKSKVDNEEFADNKEEVAETEEKHKSFKLTLKGKPVKEKEEIIEDS